MELFILVGLPASGKSTWTNNYIKNNSNTSVISQDNEIYKNVEIYKKSYTDILYDSEIMKSIDKHNYDKMISSFKENRHIIIDKTNVNIKSRRKILSNTPSHYNRNIVLFDLDRCVVNYNNFKRYLDTGKFISNKTIDFMEEIFQYPESYEYDNLIIIKE